MGYGLESGYTAPVLNLTMSTLSKDLTHGAQQTAKVAMTAIPSFDRARSCEEHREGWGGGVKTVSERVHHHRDS